MTNNNLKYNRIQHLIEDALFEDVGLGDITTDSIIGNDVLADATLIAKAPGIAAGLEILTIVYNCVDPRVTVHPSVPDGQKVELNSILALIDGPAKSLLKGERVSLNFLQRMSGIATMTRQFVDAIEGTQARIIDTRKTAPGLRALDKFAVRLGGGKNHRFGLDDMILIKDNHIVAAGGIRPALQKCLKTVREKNIQTQIEIETRSMEEVREAMACFEEGSRFHRLMVDNFSIEKMREAVAYIARRVEVEASGNITLKNVRAVAETGVDVISVGALTHSVEALDISMNLKLRL